MMANRIEIDHLVEIALNTLTAADRAAVSQVTESPEKFDLAASKAGRIFRVRENGYTLYILPVTSELRLIYTLDGDTVRALDLVMQATLDFFESLRRSESQSGPSGISPDFPSGSGDIRSRSGVPGAIGT